MLVTTLVKSALTTYHSNNIGLTSLTAQGWESSEKLRKELFCWLSNSMKKLIVGFGDSWTFGSELDFPRDYPWLVQIADKLEADYVNMSTPASSIGHLIVQLFNFIKQNNYPGHKKVFMVGLSGLTRYLTYSNQLNEFVNITPEANYRTGNIHHSGCPPEVVPEFRTMANEMYRMVECPEYNNFIVTQTIFTFEQYCRHENIDIIFFSYFDFPIVDSQLVSTDLLYPTTITHALTGQEYELPGIRSNKYFTGKLFHPNMLGHTRIAELLKEFYDQKYPRH